MTEEGILTPDEIDALLQAVNSGQIAVEESGGEAPEADARPYNITSRERVVIRGRLPTLDIINERLSRALRVSLFNYLRKPITVEHARTEMIKFGDFLSGPARNACLNLFRFTPLPGTCLMSMNNTVVFGLVDHLFGGGKGVLVQARDYSAIELRLIKRLAQLILDDVRRAWEPVVGAVPELLRIESNPAFATITAPDDIIVDIAFDLAMEPEPRGELHFVIPYTSLESIKTELGSPSFSLEEDTTVHHWRKSVLALLRETEVQFKVLLGSSEITLRELHSLKVGDTITLDTEPSRPLPCYVQGAVKAWGHAVTSRGRVAVKLAAPVGERGEQGANAPGESDERRGQEAALVRGESERPQRP